MDSIKVMLMSGPDDGLEISLDAGKDEWRIGRSEECDIKLVYDVRVSREHAILQRLPDGSFSLRDLGSRNGCIVRGQRVPESAQLAAGELFRIGLTWLRIQV